MIDVSVRFDDQFVNTVQVEIASYIIFQTCTNTMMMTYSQQNGKNFNNHHYVTVGLD